MLRMKFLALLSMAFSLLLISPERAYAARSPRLVLHFDVNKTLIAVDRAGNKSLENVISHLLAERTYWSWDKEQDEQMSYYDYVHSILIPGDRSDKELKAHRKKVLDHFISSLKTSEYPMAWELVEEYYLILSKLRAFKGDVFPSFYKMLKRLDEKELEYIIVLRSFGDKIHEVAKEINEHVGGEFFSTAASFQGAALKTENATIEDSSEIYNYIKGHGHIVIQDDWKWWNSQGEKKEYGKPFFMREDDPEIFAIFFDDKLEGSLSPTNILTPINAKTGEFLGLDAMTHNSKAIKVDTLDAILKEEYFGDLVLENLRDYNLFSNPL
ncbi:MAG: hypothetical protein ACI9S8_002747 [Chlamydiales bacterium]|jgi:hypothetical protein